jgi:hypothetical protein
MLFGQQFGTVTLRFAGTHSQLQRSNRGGYWRLTNIGVSQPCQQMYCVEKGSSPGYVPSKANHPKA